MSSRSSGSPRCAGRAVAAIAPHRASSASPASTPAPPVSSDVRDAEQRQRQRVCSPLAAGCSASRCRSEKRRLTAASSRVSQNTGRRASASSSAVRASATRRPWRLRQLTWCALSLRCRCCAAAQASRRQRRRPCAPRATSRAACRCAPRPMCRAARRRRAPWGARNANCSPVRSSRGMRGSHRAAPPLDSRRHSLTSPPPVRVGRRSRRRDDGARRRRSRGSASHSRGERVEGEGPLAARARPR